MGSSGWLLVVWLITGVLTIAGALSYGELAAIMPHAGGMYVYLREAFSPLLGFLYGWTLLTVIQTGTIAAVAIAFARFSGVLMSAVREDNYIIRPLHVLPRYALSLSTAQLVALAIILLIAFLSCCGVQWGKVVQNVFTVAKLFGMLALLVVLPQRREAQQGVRAGDAMRLVFSLVLPRTFDPATSRTAISTATCWTM